MDSRGTRSVRAHSRRVPICRTSARTSTGKEASCRARRRGRPRPPVASRAPRRVAGGQAPEHGVRERRGRRSTGRTSAEGTIGANPSAASASAADQCRADDGLPEWHQQVDEPLRCAPAAGTVSATSRRADRAPGGCPAPSASAGAAAGAARDALLLDARHAAPGATSSRPRAGAGRGPDPRSAGRAMARRRRRWRRAPRAG